MNGNDLNFESPRSLNTTIHSSGNQSYLEVGSGLNFVNQDGSLTRSEVRPQAEPDGTITFPDLPTKHQFSQRADLQTVLQTDVNGAVARSAIAGISMYDMESGNSVVIAIPKESYLHYFDEGVFYPDAFNGLYADILYKVTPSSLEQDVVLYSGLPYPSEIGISPEHAVLSIITEIIGLDAEDMGVTRRGDVLPSEPGTSAIKLYEKDGAKWRELFNWQQGFAFLEDGSFSLGGAEELAGLDDFEAEIERDYGKILLSKRFFSLNDRSFLSEEIKVSDLQDRAPFLFDPTGPRGDIQQFTFGEIPPERSVLPEGQLEFAVPREAIHMAYVPSKDQSFVIDYIQYTGTITNDLTFTNGGTYVISGNAVFSGCKLTVEPGCFVKYKPNARITMQDGAGLHLLTDGSNTATFTSSYDNNHGGEQVDTGSDPTNNRYKAAFWFESGTNTVKGLNIYYTKLSAIEFNESEGPNIVEDCQFINCEGAVEVHAGTNGTSIKNCLIVGGRNGLFFAADDSSVCNITADNIHYNSLRAYPGANSLSVQNSLFTWHTNKVFFSNTTLQVTFDHNATYSASGWMGDDQISLSSSPYETNEIGSYFINQTNASVLINAGSTNADSVGLFDYTTSHIMLPESNSVVDIGFHYWADPAYNDPDGDGMPDWWEIEFFGSLTNAGDGDVDSDGLNNSNEFAYAADPTDSDTDKDGIEDGEEVDIYGTAPAELDTDGDGLADNFELLYERYRYFDLHLTWTQSVIAAENIGDHLVAITSSNEYQSISNRWFQPLWTTHLWIGGNDIGTEGTWEWVTGESWDYSNWYVAEPNGGTAANAVFIWGNTGFAWSDGDVNSVLPFMVERFQYTSPTNLDTDADGLIDGFSGYVPVSAYTNGIDLDGDGYIEGEMTFNADPNLADTDRDGVPDGWEVKYGLDPISGYDAELYAWWPMDQTNGNLALDRSSTYLDYHGVFSNHSDSAWVSGKIGRAYEFTGTNTGAGIAGAEYYLKVPATLTLAAWVKVDPVQPGRRSIITHGDVYGLELTNGKPQFISQQLSPAGYHTASDAIETGVWTHVAATYDGSGVSLFVDGVCVHTNELSGSLSGSASPVGIGAAVGTGSYRFDGAIDDVRMYRRALTSNEVYGLATLWNDPDGDGLVNTTEYTIGTSPTVADTDGDGLPDWWEHQNAGYDPLNASEATNDVDEDGLLDWEEIQLSTSVTNSDSDADGMPDGWEVTQEFDPLDSVDGTIYIVDFANDTMSSYGGGAEDVDSGNHTNLNSGTTLALWGNNWKALHKNSQIHADSILRYSFKSTGEEGEVHGVGVDTDLTLSSSQLFQNYGTDSWGVTNFYNYQGNAEKIYWIPIGTFFTGSYDYVTFANDADAAQDTYVYYSNVKIGLDEDQDGLFNSEEYDNNSDPHVSDTDEDGLPDGWEVDHGLDPVDPGDSLADTDRDGLSNLDEYLNGTDPNEVDSDGDGISDYAEIAGGEDPLMALEDALSGTVWVNVSTNNYGAGSFTLQFNTNALEVVSISATGLVESAEWAIGETNAYTSGSAKFGYIQFGDLEGPSQTSQFVKVTFQKIGSSGTTTDVSVTHSQIVHALNSSNVVVGGSDVGISGVPTTLP